MSQPLKAMGYIQTNLERISQLQDRLKASSRNWEEAEADLEQWSKELGLLGIQYAKIQDSIQDLERLVWELP